MNEDDEKDMLAEGMTRKRESLLVKDARKTDGKQVVGIESRRNEI